jgi:hypothetical protein
VVRLCRLSLPQNIDFGTAMLGARSCQENRPTGWTMKYHWKKLKE